MNKKGTAFGFPYNEAPIEHYSSPPAISHLGTSYHISWLQRRHIETNLSCKRYAGIESLGAFTPHHKSNTLEYRYCQRM